MTTLSKDPLLHLISLFTGTQSFPYPGTNSNMFITCPWIQMYPWKTYDINVIFNRINNFVVESLFCFSTQCYVFKISTVAKFCFMLWHQRQPCAFIILICSPNEGYPCFFQTLLPQTTPHTSLCRPAWASPIHDSGTLASNERRRELSRMGEADSSPYKESGCSLDIL